MSRGVPKSPFDSSESHHLTMRAIDAEEGLLTRLANHRVLIQTAEDEARKRKSKFVWRK